MVVGALALLVTMVGCRSGDPADIAERTGSSVSAPVVDPDGDDGDDGGAQAGEGSVLVGTWSAGAKELYRSLVVTGLDDELSDKLASYFSGSVTLTVRQDGSFTETGDVTFSDGGVSGPVNIDVQGEWEISSGKVHFSATVDEMVVAVPGAEEVPMRLGVTGPFTAGASFDVSGDTMTLTFDDELNNSSVVQVWKRI